MSIIAKSIPRAGSGGVPVAAALALAALLAVPAAAQDTHYWSIQYGPVGQLVGGQLIGGVPDLSATFYNPGALSLRNESSYLLSTESVQLESVSTSSDSRILDSSSSKFGSAPSLLAGALPRWLGEDTALAWSFLTRQKLDLRIGSRIIDPFAGTFAQSAAESYSDQEITESWGGLTLSHPLSESVGLGGTLYGVYRGQRTRNELSAQGVNGARGLAVSGVTDFDFGHYRALAKLGLAWTGRSWNAGFSVTTPSLGVMGTGKASYTAYVSGVDADGDAVTDPPILESVTAEDLESEYRSSWAVGAGASWRRKNTRFYASAEWFAPVDRFAVLTLPDNPQAAQRLSQKLESVLNGGLGVEHEVSRELSVYGAFSTDFSAAPHPSESSVSVSDWDLYHVGGGVSFRFGENRFTLGALWAFGSQPRTLQTPVPDDALPASALDETIDVEYSRVTFVLGFVFGQ
jgi:hypothetical protein